MILCKNKYIEYLNISISNEDTVKEASKKIRIPVRNDPKKEKKII